MKGYISKREEVRGVRYTDIPSVYASLYRKGYSFEDILVAYIREDCTYTFWAEKKIFL